MAQIGFSTGSLYKSSIDFHEIINLYCSSKADAIELSFAEPDALLRFQLSLDLINDIEKFKYISIHAPWKKINYDSGDICSKLFSKLIFLCKELPVQGIVLHPDTIREFKILNDSGLPFLLENMDKRKSFGTHPQHFEDLKKYNLEFVLDIQHSYEHNQSIGFTKNFIETMGNRLKHMHVSGYNHSELHVPAHLADNKNQITEILKLKIQVPKILEGILLGDVKEVVKREIEFIREFD